MFFDQTMILIIPVLILAFWAQAKVKGSYNKYSQIGSYSGMTGEQIAKEILRANGVFDVKVLPIEGMLTDHYDPRVKEIHLSNEVFYGRSIAAISISAHETGHALQHAKGYYPLVLRASILPVANIGSTAAFPLFLVGLLFSWGPLMTLGIIFFAGALAFHVVTLPVEFNASARAIQHLSSGIVRSEEELNGCKSMLNAAAMTYVASTLMALMQLIRMIILKNSRD